MTSLLEPLAINDRLHVRNRVVMTSMTRNRCVDDYKPGPAQIRYYTDRVRHGAGLIITEGVLVDWGGCIFPFVPVMTEEHHADAWKKVVESVHEAGGKILLQAWHLGRVQNENMPIMRNRFQSVLAPSAIKAHGGNYRELPGSPGHTANITTIKDPREIVQIYRHSATLAKKAGFDGIELLCQGGYLPHQFLNSRSNKRTDAYGGSVENRSRFLLETVEAIGEVFGGCDLVCIKLSPVDVMNDSVTTFAEAKETYTYLITELVRGRVGIITISRRGHDLDRRHKEGMLSRPEGYPLPPGYDPVLDLGPLVKYPGSPSKLMVNQDYSVEEAETLIRHEKADLIGFGRPFICNPDVVTRIRNNIPFVEKDQDDAVRYGPYKTPDQNYNDWPAA